MRKIKQREGRVYLQNNVVRLVRKLGLSALQTVIRYEGVGASAGNVECFFLRNAW